MADSHSLGLGRMMEKVYCIERIVNDTPTFNLFDADGNPQFPEFQTIGEMKNLVRTRKISMSAVSEYHTPEHLLNLMRARYKGEKYRSSSKSQLMEYIGWVERKRAVE